MLNRRRFLGLFGVALAAPAGLVVSSLRTPAVGAKDVLIRDATGVHISGGLASGVVVGGSARDVVLSGTYIDSRYHTP